MKPVPSIIQITDFDPTTLLEAPVRCGKVAFATGAAARRAIELIRTQSRRRQGENDRGTKPQRAYHCPDCGHFHLTSEPK